MSASEFPDIEKLQKQTFQKYNQDGITELLFGVVLYMLALAYQNVAFIGVSASFVIFGPTVVLKLRNKYIYPRLGYAKVKIFPISTRRAIILVLIFSGTFAVEIISMYFIENTTLNLVIWQKWLPILFSSVILVYSLEMIKHSGNIKYILIYILALFWGIFISLTPLGMNDPIDHFAIYSLLMGIFWSIFGGIRLNNFIKKNPILNEAGEYDSGKKNKKNKITQNIKKKSTPLILFDKNIREPNRLRIISQLYVVEEADMVFLKQQLDLTWGNLSSHLKKLKEVGYVFIKKEIIEEKPRTTVKLTELGIQQFLKYRKQMIELLE